LLDLYKKEGRLPDQEVLWEGDGCRIYSDAATKSALHKNGAGLKEYIHAHLRRAESGDYVALTAYIQENDSHEKALQAIRTHVRDSLKTATTTGYGPRFLHSTGQLHKGGGANGVFIQITQDETEDLPIPGETFTFGVLKQAQALGDFQSLSNRGRRAIRFHVGNDVPAGLNALLNAVRNAFPKHN